MLVGLAVVLLLASAAAAAWAVRVSSVPTGSGADPLALASAEVPVTVAGPFRPPVADDSGLPSALPAPDHAWVARTAAATGVPARALQAYATAELRLRAEQPACDLSWPTLAGIGSVESRHGTIGGGTLLPDGRPSTGPIVGVALTGLGDVAAIGDTDGGLLDGDPVWDRAVGPMQFIPSTWRRHGADGDGDGALDPQQVDDAALAAARYLCFAGRSLTDPDGWRDAVLSYNPSDAYVAAVVSRANGYVTAASTSGGGG